MRHQGWFGKTAPWTKKSTPYLELQNWPAAPAENARLTPVRLTFATRVGEFINRPLWGEWPGLRFDATRLQARQGCGAKSPIS